MLRHDAAPAEAQEHVVHFYVDDDDLATAASSYLADGLGEGAVALVVCTPAHRRIFEQALAAAGAPVDDLIGRQRLLFADAAGTLARFTVDGRPVADRFDAVVRALLSQLAADRPVRVFGEMVGLLWDAGDVEGALAVEQLWNDLARRVEFSLFCAYAAALGSDRDALSSVCDAHSAVLAMPPRPDDAEWVEDFLCSAQSPRAARRLVAAVLDEWDCDDAKDLAMLVTSELATNAVMHARSHFSVSLRVDGARVRIGVGDTSDVPPLLRGPGEAVLGGRGIAVVAAAAVDWGYQQVPGGKIVWADITAADQAAPADLTSA